MPENNRRWAWRGRAGSAPIESRPSGAGWGLSHPPGARGPPPGIVGAREGSSGPGGRPAEKMSRAPTSTPTSTPAASPRAPTHNLVSGVDNKRGPQRGLWTFPRVTGRPRPSGGGLRGSPVRSQLWVAKGPHAGAICSGSGQGARTPEQPAYETGQAASARGGPKRGQRRQPGPQSSFGCPSRA